jgi:hypothetical protein
MRQNTWDELRVWIAVGLELFNALLKDIQINALSDSIARVREAGVQNLRVSAPARCLSLRDVHHVHCLSAHDCSPLINF